MTSKTQNTINEIIRKYVLTNLSVLKFAEFSKFAAEFYTFTNTEWNAFDLDFFDSHYDDKLINIEQTMKHVEKNTYFRDIRLFIERTKNMTIIQNEQYV